MAESVSDKLHGDKVTAEYFDSLLATPAKLKHELKGVSNFENLSRAELLKINPRYRSREAIGGSISRGSEEVGNAPSPMGATPPLRPSIWRL